jgi:hypothetical protein
MGQHPDPFANTDPKWDSYQLPCDQNLAQPDSTNSAIKDFLRSAEGRRELSELLPPQPPTPVPDYDGPRLGHLHASPTT